jgi:hypothetical protein
MSHAGEDYIGLFGADEAKKLETGVSDAPATQAVDLNPPGNWFGSRAIVCDEAEVNLKALGIEMAG